MSHRENERPQLLLREDGAEKILAGVDDPVTKNLMRLCVAEARMRLVRWKDLSDAEWEAQLPIAPFDFEFFISVLKHVFSKRETLERVLRGESLDYATGWDGAKNSME
jgi:hypothetical protein